MGGSSPSAPSSQTVTQVTQPPDYQIQEQQALNQQATALSAQPYPNYQGQLIAGLTPQQQQGMQQAQDASTSAMPDLNAGAGYAANAVNSSTPYFQQASQYANNAVNSSQPYYNMAAGMTAQAQQPWNAQTAQQYMSPYAQAALAPQIQALQLQMGQNANAINGRATQAGAYGDAQYGNEQALNNLYGNQSLNQLEQTGMNQAYNTGLGAYQSQQGTDINAASQFGNIGNSLASNNLNAAGQYNNIGQGLAGANSTAAQNMNSLGQAQSATGIAGATANFNAGTQQQALNQSQLTEAYQNFMNQANWPEQMMNLQNSMLQAGNQYTIPTANLAPNSSTAQNVGMFSQLAGGIGSLLGGSNGGK